MVMKLSKGLKKTQKYRLDASDGSVVMRLRFMVDGILYCADEFMGGGHARY